MTPVRKGSNVMNTFKNSGKLKAVTFSYDDGVSQDLRLIELLNKYGLKGTFNLNSHKLGTGNINMRLGQALASYKFSENHLKQVYEGHEVAAHTLDHINLTEQTEEEIIRQVEEDRLNLSKIMGYNVVGMAYPCGGVNNDDRVAEIIKNNTGVKYCRTTTNTDSFDIQENLYRFNPNVYHVLQYDRMMEMGKKFVELTPDKPQIFYIWGHAYEFDVEQDHWLKMEEFCRLISGRDDIFYGTNAEVLL